MSSDVPSQSSTLAKPQRVLACVLCQQRKIKCDRKFPCSNCIKSRAECVPGTLTQRRRRRRFPERELLDRLRKYEDLLRQNNIPFEPFYKDAVREQESLNEDSEGDHQDGLDPPSSALSPAVKSETDHGAKNVWHAMSLGYRDPDQDSDSSHDDVRETTVKKAWESTAEINDHLLLGPRRIDVRLSTLHPDPAQIFRLWQIYLDNINPLLRVTHTPTLQGYIIEAASRISDIEPNLEALMFGIYCIALFSITDEDCQSMFGSSLEVLKLRYQLGCQQALLNCGFLRTNDRNCLTALYFYIITIRTSTVAQSVHSILGSAVRIAQRMGLHSEAALAKCTILEAEMRRRLWWSLIMFDARVAEMANSCMAALDPSWDCKIPRNVNDSDLRVEMKTLPASQPYPTDALYAVVRSELGDFVRHTAFHLDFINPALKHIAKHAQDGQVSEGSELLKLEKTIEDQYFKSCDPENPVHYMTMWAARGFLAKCRLVEHNLKYSTSPAQRTDAQRDIGTALALRMLECDTKLTTSPLTKGFLWMQQCYFPFPAFVQLAQDLRRRPYGEHTRRAWAMMSANSEPMARRFDTQNPFFQIFVKLILPAWDACEAAYKQSGEDPEVPMVVTRLRNTLARTAPMVSNTDSDISMGTGVEDFPTPVSTDFTNPSLPFNMGQQYGFPMMSPEIYSGLPAPTAFDPRMNRFNWGAAGGWPNWGGS